MLKIISTGLFCLLFTQTVFAQSMMDEVRSIQTEWAHIKYQLDEDARSDAFEALIIRSDALIDSNPDKAEPLIWSAIVYSSYAGAVGGLKSVTRALPAVKRARDLLLESESIDPHALNGSATTTLGALFYQVPGWPLGFGNKETARNYLEKAVELNPDGLDSNFFYGDFLLGRKEYQKAVKVLEHALAAPTLENRPVADQGRRNEIQQRLEEAKSHLS